MSQPSPFLFTGGGQQAPLPPPQQGHNAPTVPQPPSTGYNMPATQTQATQQNSVVPGLPANLAAVLQGVSPEQLVAILQAVHSGQLNLPQPVTAPAPNQGIGSGQTTAPSAQFSLGGAVQQEGAHVDKEEGELEDGEEPEPVRQRDFLRPPPTGPRKRSPSPHDRYGRAQSGRRAPSQAQIASPKQSATQRRPSQTQRDRQDPVPSNTSQRPSTNGAAPARRSVDAGAAARAFVLQMHQNGYTFDQLATEIPNRAALTRMYKTLGLPLPAEPQANGPEPRSSQPPQVNILNTAFRRTPPTAPAETRKPSLSKRPPPPAKPAAAIDRAEYLAKLAAARTSKGKAPTATAMQTPATVSVQQQPVQTQPESAVEPPPAPQPAVPTAAMKPTVQSNNIKTELIKQRIEKLKADQAAKALAAQQASDGSVASSPLTKSTHAAGTPQGKPSIAGSANGLGAGLTPRKLPSTSQATPPPAQSIHAAPAPLQTSFSPTHPTPNRPFSSLPGLFMASTPIQPSPSQQTAFAPPTAAPQQFTPSGLPPRPPPPFAASSTIAPSPAGSPAPLNVNRKRPVAADFDTDIPASTAPAAPKRPLFGQSRSDSESERVVIEVSEDEDDADDMDLDAGPAGASADDASKQHSAHPVGPLPGFPTKPSFISIPGTPPVQTPGSAADMDKAIADLRRRIAEKEANKAGKVNEKSAMTASEVSTPASGKSTPLMTSAAAPLSSTSGASDPSTQLPPQASAKSSSATTKKAIARSLEKARLEARLKELHETFARQDGTTASPALAIRDSPRPRENVSTPSAVVNGEAKAATAPPGPAPEDALPTANAEMDQMEAVALSQAENNTIGSQATTVTATSQPQSEATGLDSIESENTAALAAGAQVVTSDFGLPVLDDDVEMESDSGSSDEDNEDDESDDLNGTGEQLTSEAALENQQTGDESDDDDPDSDSSEELQDVQARPDPDQEEEADYEPQSEVDPGQALADEDDYEPEPASDEAATNHNVTSPEVVLNTISDVDNTKSPAGNITNAEIADDLAPELQPVNEEPTATVDQGEQPKRKEYFRPYESPLTKFKDYRYHPNYLATVTGGFKSMSYSHKIDPDQELCPYEAAGGQCNDRKCENQHFRSMGITDSDLLKALGTVRTPTSTPEDLQRWKAGLGQVVKSMRDLGGMNDVESIAARIAIFRREFVGGGRVVNLG